MKAPFPVLQVAVHREPTHRKMDAARRREGLCNSYTKTGERLCNKPVRPGTLFCHLHQAVQYTAASTSGVVDDDQEMEDNGVAEIDELSNLLQILEEKEATLNMKEAQNAHLKAQVRQYEQRVLELSSRLLHTETLPPLYVAQVLQTIKGLKQRIEELTRRLEEAEERARAATPPVRTVEEEAQLADEFGKLLKAYVEDEVDDAEFTRIYMTRLK